MVTRNAMRLAFCSTKGQLSAESRRRDGITQLTVPTRCAALRAHRSLLPCVTLIFFVPGTVGAVSSSFSMSPSVDGRGVVGRWWRGGRSPPGSLGRRKWPFFWGRLECAGSLLLDDKSSTWHAVTGQPRASDSGRCGGAGGSGRVTVLVGQRRYCFCSRAARAGCGRMGREQV